MSDASMAEIARRLAAAMMLRARTRLPEDTKAVAVLQTELCAEYGAELDPQNTSELTAPQG